MTTVISNKLYGEFRLVVNRSDNTQTDTGWFRNLILNQGLDVLGTYDQNLILDMAQVCKVGTGNATPAITQSGLQSQIAEKTRTSSNITNSGAPLYKNQCEYYYEFAVGDVVGNIAEIGVGWETGIGSLFSRALILDGSGNPTTISLGSGDQLRAYYRLNIVPQTNDFSGILTIGSNTYNWDARHSYIVGFDVRPTTQSFGYLSECRAYSSDMDLGPIDGYPTASDSALNNITTIAPYNSGNYYLDITYIWNINTANFGGIGGFRVDMGVGTNNAFQIKLNGVIAKDDTKSLSITIRNIWGRL